MPKFLVPIDLDNNELQNVLLENVLSGNITATNRKGQILFNSSDNRPTWNDGSEFHDIYPPSTSPSASTFVLRDGSGEHSATTLETARDFSLTGKATAAGVSFDGSGNVAIDVTALDVAASEIALADGKFLVGDSGGAAEEVLKTAIPLSGFGSAAADVSMGGYKLTSLGTPTATTDAATKAYVDNTSSGLTVKDAVKYATTAALTYDTYTYPGATAVGAKMTSAPGATLTVDGGTVAIGERVLVKNESSEDRNGIYERSADDGTSWVLTRATDFDADSEVSSGDFVFVTSGSTNAASGWVLSSFGGTLSVDGTPGDDLVFTQFSGAGTYTGGRGIVVDGTDIHFAKSSAYTVGGLFYADGASTLAELSAAATGNALISGGVGTAPAWGKIGLTTHVSGNLPVGNGGVGITSYTAGDTLFAISSDTLDKLAIGAADKVMKSTGSEPSWGFVDFDELTGELSSSQMCALSGDVSNTLGSGVITVEKLTRQTETNAANLPDFTGLKAFYYTDGSSGYPDAYAYGGGIYFSRLATEGTGRRGSWQMVSKMAEELEFYVRKIINSSTNEWSSWFKLWHSGNDGAGSTLDADLLDGEQGSYYLDPNNLSSVVPASKGGTGSAYFQVSGPATSVRTVTFMNANHTVPAFKSIRISGNNIDTAFVLTHGLGTKDLVITIRDEVAEEIVYLDVEFTSNDSVTVSFTSAPQLGEDYKVTMVGY
jgi:hypothetical protein